MQSDKGMTGLPLSSNLKPHPYWESSRSRLWSRAKSVILIVATLFLVSANSYGHVSRFVSDNILNRLAFQASSGIAWSSCADLTEFECAYLSVPMDYTQPLPNETVSLALRRLPATAPKKERMGTLFINPGGPGGSGTALVAQSAKDLSMILKGRYDVLSWDPRGVNMTTPALDCYPTEFDSWIQDYKQAQLGLPFEARQANADGSEASDLAWYEKMDAYYRASVASCARNGNQKMLQSVSTAFVVHDMVRILEALGEEERGMQYWGFSYGTILGATFAAMYPELVHRLVLDGVASANLYSRNVFDLGRSALDDTNKVWAGFLDSCAHAGPDGCALAEANSTADDVSARVDGLIERLITKPLAVPFAGTTSGILTASDVKQGIFRALYAPRSWPTFAKALADADNGDGVALAELTGAPALTDRRDPLDNVFKRRMETSGGLSVGAAIMCSDTDPSVARASPSANSFRDFARELADLSITGETWATILGKCRLWNVTATEAYRGPWTVDEGLRTTKFPVLWIGNTGDPVTPLSAAKSMSSGFGNESATLLIQDGYGHCSLAHPSLCTARAIASYFFDGAVPAYGTTCVSDEGYLFPTAEMKENRVKSLSDEDKQLVEAMERLSESMQHW